MREVSAVRHDEAKVFGQGVSVDGIAPNFASSVRQRYSQGSDAVIPRLGSTGAIVTKGFADDHSLRVGSPVRITTSAGRTLTVRVAAITDRVGAT